MIPMHVLPVGGLFVTAFFKALGTARYLHKPVCMPFLTLRPHIDVTCVVFSSEENDEGADRGFHCGAQVGLSTWVSEMFVRATFGSADVELSSVFGFTAALLETLPFVGLIFSVSNRIGAAMWAHGMQKKFIGLIGTNSDLDLEKRQHWFSEKKRKSS
jgi:hypothetical protein